MQFLRSKQQQTTCPQCDNIVRADAEVCNICGQRLKGIPSKVQLQSFQENVPLTSTQPVQAVAPSSTRVEEDDDEEEYEDEDEEYEEEEDDELPGYGAGQPHITKEPVQPASLAEISARLNMLNEQAASIEHYFPTAMPNKTQKMQAWKRQLQRAAAYAQLFEHPRMEEVESDHVLKIRQHLEEATRALDFTHEYSVKIIGHAGAGKSTLLAALIGQDIFPRLAGGAVTGVRTRIRLCSEQEPEELQVHFLTRSAFDEILKQTQRGIQQTSSPRQREALARELSLLLKASEAFAEQYLNDEQPHIEYIAREHWQSEANRYIEEPARDSQEPRLIRLIDYVEYRIHATSQSLLPPGSVLVDLPGGSAGQPHHDRILAEELDQVDAVILVIGNNRFGDDERTQRIFELVKRKITQSRSPEVAAAMIFLAVTHWDEITSLASLEKAQGSLRPLLRDLPAGYSTYHHHSANHGYFFYPLRTLDALFATLGLAQQEIDEEHMQEAREYVGRMLSVYPELLKIDPSLPTHVQIRDFQEVSRKHHQAMLTFSGLPELSTDLQSFLSGNRYDVQLRHAETQLTVALQHMEELCWEHLNNHGLHSRDLEELQQELQIRKNKRSVTRFEQLQRRTNDMHSAWNEALTVFDEVMSVEHNPFHHALATAHQRTLRRIKERIAQGHFDHFIKVSNQGRANSPAMEIGNRWVDIDGWGLIKDLRVNFSAALEREMNEPARSLAEAFLLPLAHKEEGDGTLDINFVALGESGGDLDEIQKTYHKLKRNIREKARDICLYVTMSELLNEDKYAPTKDNPAVSALYRLAASQPGRPEDLIQQARHLMGPILDAICSSLAKTTERRIIHLFRYELDKLESRQVYESDRLDAPPSSVPGAFADIVNSLYSLLTERILTSETFRQQLDMLQSQREAVVDRWVELLHEADMLRVGRGRG